MIRINSDKDFFNFYGKPFKHLHVIDVGCGNGDLVRWLASKGAIVSGIEQEDMVVKASGYDVVNGEMYYTGGGEALPFDTVYADLLIYMASFHHIPVSDMLDAMKECRRVMKNHGEAWFVEPVYESGSYTQLINLVNNEGEIQAAALKVLNSAEELGLETFEEGFYYFERSLEDYRKLLELHVDDLPKRTECITAAEKITEKLAAENEIPVSEYRYKSVCRLRKLKKK